MVKMIVHIQSILIIVPFITTTILFLTSQSNCQLSLMPTVSPVRLFGTITGASSVIPTYRRLVQQFTNSVSKGSSVTFDSPYTRFRNKQQQRQKEKIQLQAASNVKRQIVRIPPRVGQVMMTEPLLEIDSDENLVSQSLAHSFDNGNEFHQFHPMMESSLLPKSLSILEIINGKVLPNGEKVKFMYPIRILDSNTIFEPDEWHDSGETIDSAALLSPTSFEHSFNE